MFRKYLLPILLILAFSLSACTTTTPIATESPTAAIATESPTAVIPTESPTAVVSTFPLTITGR